MKPAFLLCAFASLLLLSGARAAGAQTLTEVLTFSDVVDGEQVGFIKGVAVGPDGDVYVTAADAAYRVRPGLRVKRIIDSTGDGAGNPLSNAGPITVDEAGNVYVVGRTSLNVFEITPSGAITEILDSEGNFGSPNGSRLGFPQDVITDPNTGDVYVSHHDWDYFRNGVFRITPSGVITHVLDIGSWPFGFRAADPLAVDSASNLYCGGEGMVLRRAPDGTITQFLGPTVSTAFVTDIEFDSTGDLIVVRALDPEVHRVDPTGSIEIILDATGDGAGNTLDLPSNVEIDSSDNVYVGATGSDNVFRITPEGTKSQVIGFDGTPPYVSLAGSIAVDANENLYLVYGGPDRGVLRVGAPVPLPALNLLGGVTLIGVLGTAGRCFAARLGAQSRGAS